MEPVDAGQNVFALPNSQRLLDNFHVVLVEPAYSLNVGGVARAMMNFGFRHLHLVAPVNYEPERAAVTALTARPLLENLYQHDTLAHAVGDMEEVVALAMRPGKNPSQFATLPDWASGLAQKPVRKTALVFGPEESGLRQEHLNLCRWVVRIPSTHAFASLNLAQSVLLTLYEVSHSLPHEHLQAPPSTLRWATRNDYLLLDQAVESVMKQSGFVMRGPQPPASQAVRNLFGRLELTAQEVGILLSLFERVDGTLKRSGQKPSLSQPSDEDTA